MVFIIFLYYELFLFIIGRAACMVTKYVYNYNQERRFSVISQSFLTHSLGETVDSHFISNEFISES